MRPAVRDAFVAITVPLEGNIATMYRDSLGFVTVGIGNKIDPLTTAGLALPFRTRDRGRWALEADIRAEWGQIKAGPLGAGAAAKIAELELSEADRLKLLDDKLADNEAVIRAQFAGWASWPADAQLAVLSMAWNFGPAFKRPPASAAGGWPDLATHLDQLDFEYAAQHCEPSVGSSARSRQNKVLFYQAARARLFAADPATLFGPAVTLSTAQFIAQTKTPNDAHSVAWWVQACLQDAGVYTYALDGKFGARSAAAWSAFLKAHRLPAGYSMPNLKALSAATLRVAVAA
jgi:GH24 family phage-related lysozyme (muramidase)